MFFFGNQRCREGDALSCRACKFIMVVPRTESLHPNTALRVSCRASSDAFIAKSLSAFRKDIEQGIRFAEGTMRGNA